ncbi:MAG: hypothetical protein MR649_00905 [Prevotella sp.]|nr:hypothetical protein [Prevotella sp.]MCI7786113.1 hypothetical protein [Prevotella sp.]
MRKPPLRGGFTTAALPPYRPDREAGSRGTAHSTAACLSQAAINLQKY